MKNNSELKKYLKEINIEFRKKLPIPNFTSFGQEIEFVNINQIELFKMVEAINNTHKLSTILYSGEQNIFSVDKFAPFEGLCEIQTPILINDEDNFHLFALILDTLKKMGGEITSSCGSHININGLTFMQREHLILLLKIFIIYEPILYKFGYGYADMPRKSLLRERQTRSMGPNIINVKIYNNIIEKLEKKLCEGEQKFDEYFNEIFVIKNIKANTTLELNNLKHKINNYQLSDNHLTNNFINSRVEFRFFSGTLDKEIAQNNINLILNMVNKIINDELDLEEIEFLYRKVVNEGRFSYDNNEPSKKRQYDINLMTYTNIPTKDIAEFADKFFCNEIDKYYFIKQGAKIFSEQELYNKVFNLSHLKM